MRCISFFALAASVVSVVTAHYTFSGLLVNGDMVGVDWQYVREHDRGYMPTFKEEAASSDDFRCNQNAASGVDTEVYTVKPGDTVGLRQAFDPSGMKHPGPTQIYISKAPGSVKEYDGSGDWIKIHQGLICKENPVAQDLLGDAWCMWGDNHISGTIPDDIPDGEYLFRVEHIALHGAHDGKAEFYYSCGQIKVEGSAATSMPDRPTTLIPGVYQVDDEAINFSIWGSETSYPYVPGIEVISGGEVRGSADGSSGDVTVKVEGDNDDTEVVDPPQSSAPSPSIVTLTPTSVASATSTAASVAPTTSGSPAPATTLVTSIVPPTTTGAPDVEAPKDTCRAHRPGRKHRHKKQGRKSRS